MGIHPPCSKPRKSPPLSHGLGPLPLLAGSARELKRDRAGPELPAASVAWDEPSAPKAARGLEHHPEATRKQGRPQARTSPGSAWGHGSPQALQHGGNASESNEGRCRSKKRQASRERRDPWHVTNTFRLIRSPSEAKAQRRDWQPSRHSCPPPRQDLHESINFAPSRPFIDAQTARYQGGHPGRNQP